MPLVRVVVLWLRPGVLTPSGSQLAPVGFSSHLTTLKEVGTRSLPAHVPSVISYGDLRCLGDVFTHHLGHAMNYNRSGHYQPPTVRFFALCTWRCCRRRATRFRGLCAKLPKPRPLKVVWRYPLNRTVLGTLVPYSGLGGHISPEVS